MNIDNESFIAYQPYSVSWSVLMKAVGVYISILRRQKETKQDRRLGCLKEFFFFSFFFFSSDNIF